MHSSGRLCVQKVLVGSPFHYEVLRVTKASLGSTLERLIGATCPPSHPEAWPPGSPARPHPKHREPLPQSQPGPPSEGACLLAGICLLWSPHQEQLHPGGPETRAPCPGEPGLASNLLFFHCPSGNAWSTRKPLLQQSSPARGLMEKNGFLIKYSCQANPKIGRKGRKVTFVQHK